MTRLQEKMLHTPGPWETGGDNDSMSMQLMVYADDSLGSRIADCSESGFGITHEQATANVRLIAAAPDLLRALIDLADWLAYGLSKADGAEPTAEDHAACERVAAQARAAVDKALGVAR